MVHGHELNLYGGQVKTEGTGTAIMSERSEGGRLHMSEDERAIR